MKELFTKLDKFYEGLDEAASVVASTLGPDGRNVYIQEQYGARATNDGARIAYNIFFTDPEKNAGAYVVKNAAAKTNDDVGDGTTTTCVFLKAILREAKQSEENPSVIRKSLDGAVKKAVKLLAEKAEPLKQSHVEEVALVSAEYPDLARMVSEITAKLGIDSMIAIADSPTTETTYEISEGYKLDTGIMTPWLYTDQRAQNAVHEDIPVFITTKKISKVQDIKKITDALDSRGIDKCVFMVAEIEESVLAVLVASQLKGNFKSVVIRIHQDILEDVVAITGSVPVADAAGRSFSNMRFEDLGHLDKIIVDKNTTLMVGNTKGSANRALELEVNAAAEDNDILKNRLLERAARLRGKIAVIKVGSNSDFSREHKKDKAQDVVKAVPAAAAEGLVRGMGMTWKEIAGQLGDSVGEQILKKALIAPYEQICENSGQKLDAKNIKDPAKVERIALENAAEAAGIVLTLNAFILSKEEPRNPNS